MFSYLSWPRSEDLTEQKAEMLCVLVHIHLTRSNSSSDSMLESMRNETVASDPQWGQENQPKLLTTSILSTPSHLATAALGHQKLQESGQGQAGSTHL